MCEKFTTQITGLWQPSVQPATMISHQKRQTVNFLMYSGKQTYVNNIDILKAPTVFIYTSKQI